MPYLAGQRTLRLLVGIALLLFAFVQAATVNALWSNAGQSGNPIVTVAAASYAPLLAPDSIAAAFGNRLATHTEAATSQPLPTSIAGTTVKVNGTLAQLFFVSPTQVNYVIPTGTAPGAASVVVTSGDGAISTGTAQVSAVAPAVFSANANGAGAPAAVLIRVRTDGTQVFEPVAQLDPGANLFLPKPIIFEATGERLFLIIYLCGIRNAPDSDSNPDNGVAESIRVTLGGNPFTPIFAGAAPGFAGLDQINIELARSLNGRVSTQIEFASVTANITEIELAAPGRTATSLALSSSASTAVYGQTVTFTAQANASGGAPTGMVIFRDGATTLGAGSLNAGRATISASALAVGAHQITAHYGGDNSFSGNWAKLNGGQTIGKAATSVAITSSVNPSVTGQAVTFTAQVSASAPGSGASTGQVIFTDNGMMIGKQPLDGTGKAAINIPLSLTGDHAIAAIYEGVGNFNGSAGSLGGGQKVNKGQTGVVVTSSPNPSGRDQAVVLTAGVNSVAPAAGTPTGVVQFKDGGANLGAPITLINRRAEMTVSTLRLGDHSITAEYYGDPNFLSSDSAALAQYVNTPPLQVGAIIRPPLVYASDEITIQGSGFSSDPAAHEVQVIDGDGNRTTGKVEAATIDQLRVRIPFGAGSGRVKVILQQSGQQGESESPDLLQLTTSASGFVQEAAKQPDGSVAHSPIPGVTLRAFGTAGLIASAVTNADGSFVVKFPASAVFGNTIDLEVDGSTVAGSLPYPTEKRKMRVRPNRDNQYNGDTDASGVLLANIIELKRAGTATTGSLASNSSANERLSAPAPASPEETRDSVTSGNVTFDTNNSTITCPGGATNCRLTLTVLDAGRTPANLPARYFSSTIAQITPFGATLAPGGKLIFPNSDGIPAGAPVRVFGFDQTANGANLGKFVDIGPATISADGSKLETASNAVTQTSYYFVSRQWPVATIIGKVIDSDGRVVRRAVVNARGQSVFTDNLGGFVLSNVPVITPDGLNDQVTIEISFVRADGSVSRTQRVITGVKANDSIQLTEDFVLPLASVNRQPKILAPSSLLMNENETRDFNFIAFDADGHLLDVTVTGAPFAALIAGINNSYTLRLAPGANTVNNYTLVVKATDTPDRGVSLSAMQTIALTVQRDSGAKLTANYVSVTTNEDTPVNIALTASNPVGGPLNYLIVSQPAHGVLSGGAGPNLTYTAEPNFNGLDSFSFKVSGAGGESNVAAVLIAVRPVNDPPILSIVGATTVNAGETMTLKLAAIDVDVGQTIRFSGTNLPPGSAIITESETSAQFVWTPVMAQFGSRTLSFTVQDDGAPIQSETRTVAIRVDAKWAATSGPEGGQINAFLDTGKNLLIATTSNVYFSNDQGISWHAAVGALEGVYVAGLTSIGSTLFAVDAGGGTYRSTDDGRTWAFIKEPSFSFVRAFLAQGTTLFAGTTHDIFPTRRGVYRTLDRGATWVKVGLSDSNVYAMAANDTAVFAATERDGVFRSTNNGAIWAAVNSGLPDCQINGTTQKCAVNALAADGIKLYAATVSGVFFTANNGASWVPLSVNNGLANSFITAIAAKGETIYAGTLSGIYRSINGGASWNYVSNGIPNDLFLSVYISNTAVFAGSYGNGVARSTDGASWRLSNAGHVSTLIWGIVPSGDYLVAATGATGVFRSDNRGASWTPANGGLDTFAVSSLIGNGNELLLGTQFGVFRSTNQAASWAAPSQGSRFYVKSLAAKGSLLFAGTLDRGVFRSTDNGLNWTPVNSGLTNLRIDALTIRGNSLFAGTYSSGIFRSDDNGQNWTPVSRGLGPNLYVRSLAVAGSSIFAGTFDEQYNTRGVFRSDDNGASWIPAGDPRTFFAPAALAVNGSEIYVGIRFGGVYRSQDNGANWARLNDSLNDLRVSALSADSSDVYVGTGTGVSRLGETVQSWAEINANLPSKFINAIAADGAKLRVGTLGGGLSIFSEQSQSWTAINNGLPVSANVQAVATIDKILFVGLFGQGVYRSTNDGTNWTEINNGLPTDTAGAISNPRTINALKIGGGALFAATDGGVYRLDNFATNANWAPTSLTSRTRALAVNGSTIYAGTFDGGVYRSTNQGQTWEPFNQGLGSLAIISLGVSADSASIFAGTESGICRLSPQTQVWTAVNQNLPTRLPVFAFAAFGEKLYAGSVYGVFLSTDNGTSWKQVNAGLFDIYVTSLAVSSKTLIAGTRTGGVFTSRIP